MNDPTLIGPCADYEHDLLDLHDGALPPVRASQVREHLGQCARCLAWQAEFTALDARLAAELPRPQLSAGFDARLQQRLASLQRAPARGDLRARVEREHESLLGALQSAARRRAVLGATGGAMATLCVLAVARGLLASDSVAVPLGVEGVQRLVALGAVGVAIALAALAWSFARYGVGTLGLRR
jgi:anti-sigma factor RsiW